MKPIGLKGFLSCCSFYHSKKERPFMSPKKKMIFRRQFGYAKKMSLVLPFSISLFWYFLATLDKFQLLKLVNHSQSSSLVGKTSQTIVVFKECELLIECLDSGLNSLSHTFFLVLETLVVKRGQLKSSCKYRKEVVFVIFWDKCVFLLALYLPL